MKFKVIIKEDLEDGGYNVSCPALPGCHSQGNTIEEALENIKDAIQGCMEVINERATKKMFDEEQKDTHRVWGLTFSQIATQQNFYIQNFIL